MKVNSKMALLFWLCGKLSIDHKKNLYARITIGGVRAEISLGRQVRVDLWNQKVGQLKQHSLNSSQINRYISEVRLKLEKIYDLLESQYSIVTAEMVKEQYIGRKKERRHLVEVIDFLIAKFQNKVRKGLRAEQSLSKWKTVKWKVEQFLKFGYKAGDIELSKITYSFAADFVDYLTTEQDIGTNTAFKYFKHVKHALKVAVDRGWLAVNPIQGFRSTYVHPERNILDYEELMRLYNKRFSIPRLEEVKDAYLFMCFTGYAFKDASSLSTENITKHFDGEDWIIKNRQKTWCRENVPILPIADEIIRKYETHLCRLISNKLLPFISNQKFNAYIKEVASLCGIEKNLTAHTARHTFATTVTLANGVPIETVSALLGHKSIRTTQIYARIVAEKISRDMKELKGKLQIRMPRSMIKCSVGNW